MSKRRYDALMIDFYGTLTAGDRMAVDQACRKLIDTCGLNTTSQEFAVKWGKRFFKLIDDSNHESFRTLHECELISLHETMNNTVIDFDPTPFVSIIEAYWADPPLQLDVYDCLKQIDIPICCVSNADTRPLLQAIEKHGLKFDAIISSEDVRCYKPNSGIFQRAMEILGVQADRVMHIGDSLHSDIGGASGCGIAATWICREDRIHDIGNCKPDYEISTLADLPSILSM